MANEHSQIVPSMQPTAKVADFKFWCQKVLPLVYDDSLSYYEVLNKMVVYLNQVIDNINADIDNVAELEDDFLLLQEYVNNFFDDIDQLATYAERAEAAETAALSSAASAAESASNSATSASNAAGSASTAASMATTALNAKDAAVAAKTAAEAALANAQTAATNAAASATAASGSATNAAASAASALQNFQLSDAARTAAQSAASSAENDAADAADSAAEAIAAVDTVINGLGNITKTIENVPVATTEDALASIPKKLAIDIVPVQSGSGDPSPENERPITGWSGANVKRTGKNIFGGYTVINAYINTRGVITSNSENRTYVLPCSPSTQYTLSVSRTALTSDRDDIAVVEFQTVNEPTVNSEGTILVNNTGYNDYIETTFTTGANAKWLAIKIANTTKTDASATANATQLEVNSNPTVFEAFSGTTYSITFSPFSDDITFINGKYYNDSGELTDSANTKYEEDYIPVYPVNSYVINYTSSSPNNIRVHEYDANKTWLRQIINTSSTSGSNSKPYNPSADAAFIRFSLPATATDISITATVYGATLIYENGEWKLDVSHGYIAFDGSSDESWSISGDTQNNQYIIRVENCLIAPSSNSYYGLLSNILPEIRGSDGYSNNNIYGVSIWNGTAGQIRISIPIDVVNRNVNGFKTWLSSNPVFVYYPLATPVEYPLTEAQTIELLNGINNVWADTGNINTLEYFTNAENYVTSQIDLAKALIAPVLKEMKADTALVANDFRIVGNTLYRITGNIASGGILTPNTNCVATTVGAILKSLLSA